MSTLTTFLSSTYVGYTGSGGTTGTTGYSGSQGVIGYTGSKGDQGVIGYTGSQGIQGVIGYTGSQGPIGYTGSQGVIGYTGSKGDQGVIGYTGSAGPVSASSTDTFSNKTISGADNTIKINEAMTVSLSDESTAITTGTSKLKFRAPFAMTLYQIPRASLSTASTSGTPTIDINEAGVSILSTRITIDANETTSTTAVTAAVLSDTSIADDAELTFDIDVAGTGAKGLKVTLYYRRT